MHRHPQLFIAALLAGSYAGLMPRLKNKQNFENGGFNRPMRGGKSGHLPLWHYSPVKRARNKARRQAIKRQRQLVA